MITLYGTGPFFNLPDPSPFVCKAMILLKMAGLDYQMAQMSFREAPKGKMPYMKDGDTLIADSTFIRFHIERTHGIDFDKGHRPEDVAMAWSVERMLEEHLYWVLVRDRWIDEANFARGPAEFFKAAAAPIRPFVKAMIRRQVRKTLWAHGMGRHSAAEANELGRRDLEAVSQLLGRKDFLLGDRPCGADATVLAFLMGILCPLFESETRRAAEAMPNLVAYTARLKAIYLEDR